MKTWTLPFAVLGCALALNTAHADQCQWVTPAQAEKAQQLLAKHTSIVEYCEPCGEKAPGMPYAVKDVSIATPSDGYKEIEINGKGVDLAYTFVKISSTKYKNLANLAGCPAQDVSKVLTIADETPNGVVITPDTRPVPPQSVQAFAAPPIEPLPVPPPPPQQHFTYHTTTVVQPIPWIVLLLAAGGGFLTGSALTMLLMAMRTRRRAMRPRASDLPTS